MKVRITKKLKKIISLSVVFVFSLTIVLNSFAGTMKDLGTLGGTNSKGYSINDAGQVVGQAKKVTRYVNNAFLFQNGIMKDLGPAGTTTSIANEINSKGQIVGMVTSSTKKYAFLYEAGVMKDLSKYFGLKSEAIAINENGQILATGTDSKYVNHVYIYQNGKATTISALDNNDSEPHDINDSGQVVGMYTTKSGQRHAFLYSNGVLKDLFTLGGSESVALSINNNGQIVGYSLIKGDLEEHAFLYQGGVMKDLGCFGGTQSKANSINSTGVIVGSYTPKGIWDTHAFIWKNGFMKDLGGTEATYISNSGLITGESAGHAFSYDFLNGDIEPPTAPQGLKSVSVNSNSINISWTASKDNVGVVGYEVYRDGKRINTVKTTSYLDTGLQEGTSYSYYIKAKDLAGNLSLASNPILIMTSSVKLTNGLRSLGLDPTATVLADGVNLSYVDLVNQRPLLVRNSDTPKNRLLRNIFKALGANMIVPAGGTETKYDLRMQAAQRAIAIRTGIADAKGMDLLTWSNLRTAIENYGINSASFDKKLYATEFEKQVKKLLLEDLGINATSSDISLFIDEMNRKPSLTTESTGNDVTMLQRMLKGLGMTIDNLSFYNDYQSKSAVEALQYKCGLTMKTSINSTDWTKFIELFELYSNNSDKAAIKNTLIMKQTERINYWITSNLQVNITTSMSIVNTLDITAQCKDADTLELKVFNGSGQQVWPLLTPLPQAQPSVGKSVYESVYDIEAKINNDIMVQELKITTSAGIVKENQKNYSSTSSVELNLSPTLSAVMPITLTPKTVGAKIKLPNGTYKIVTTATKQIYGKTFSVQTKKDVGVNISLTGKVESIN